MVSSGSLAQQSEADFRGFRLGATYEAPSSFTYAGEVVAGPGVRVNLYTRAYDAEETVTINGVGVYRGRVVLKSQLTYVHSKTACADGIVLMVEGLISAGVGNWQKSWREDYQVPVYKAHVQSILAKVTCRMREGMWFLEYMQALKGFDALN
jgi:hypothetical protein